MSNVGLLKHLLVIKITQTKDCGFSFKKYMLRKFLKNVNIFGSRSMCTTCCKEKLMKKDCGEKVNAIFIEVWQEFYFI